MRRSRLVLLSLPLLLAACGTSAPDPQVADGPNPYAGGKSYPWSDRLDPVGPNPYAGGRAYPWTGPRVASDVSAQGLNSGTNFLSDLSWTSASSAWGPIEKDRSNGEQAPGDGRTLIIGGQTFAKGLGMHANGEVRYALNGQCGAFSASVGLDDEVGNRGSAVFQVWNGDQKLYDSGVLRGADSARPIAVDVSGVQELRLVVTNGGDNIDYDHVDWADARVVCSAPPPTGSAFLSDLAYNSATNGWGPVELDRSNGEQALGDGRTLSIGGRTFQKGLGVHANSVVDYNLAGRCTTFTAQVGVDDEVGDRGSVLFEVYADGPTTNRRKLYFSGLLTGRDAPQAVNVDVTGVRRLVLVVSNEGDGIDYDHANWAAARVECAGATAGPSGTPDSSFSRINPGFVVVDSVVQPDGKLVLFGLLSTNSDVPRYTIARYNADGSVDTGFGTGGRTSVTGGSANTAIQVTLQADGKIVGLGRSTYPEVFPNGVLIRLLPNGQPDTTLSGDGLLQTSDLPPVSKALVVQPDGRIVVAGGNQELPGYAGTDGRRVTDFVGVRLLPTGQLDSSFGSGGRVVTPLSVNAIAEQLVLQPDGKIVAGGTSEYYQTGPYRGWSLVRYLPNGTLDSTFGYGGKGGAWSDRFNRLTMTDLELQADGQFVAIGEDSRSVCVLSRVTSDGTNYASLRPSFTGPVAAPTVALQGDNKLVVAGCGREDNGTRLNDPQKTVFRLGTDGLLDTSFGNAGFATVENNRNVLLQPGGKIIVGFNPIVRLFP